MLTPGYGYLGILVSWLAGHDPLLVLIMAVFYGILMQGGAALQIAQIDPSLVRVILSGNRSVSTLAEPDPGAAVSVTHASWQG